MKYFLGIIASAMLVNVAQAQLQNVAEILVNQSQYRDFIARQGIHLFPAHDVNFIDTQYYLIKGDKESGGCRFTQNLSADLDDYKDNLQYGSIDIAVDENTCEKLVQKGMYKEDVSFSAPEAQTIEIPSVKGSQIIPINRSEASSSNATHRGFGNAFYDHCNFYSKISAFI